MNTQTTRSYGRATIGLSGRFCFDSHREFRAAYDPLIGDPEVQTVVLDFAGVDYLDSAALGMLLLLREKLGAVGQEVEISGVAGVAKQILDVANFSRLFRIS